MRELIQTEHEACTGCNRCVRECPMETANITYKDADGGVKVIIDHEKCVACGRCIKACKHNARYYEDDTEMFFDDLRNGESISLIAAPSIRSNIPEWKRLFTHFKNAGIKKIYDVSLGADICIWAHVRHLQNNRPPPIITQPCPVVVAFCKMYRHDLLENLSPIHSPMGCLSIYMKEYEGITDKIAAFSPCVAKANEFDHTKLAQYNITFAGLYKYLTKNNIELPQEETGFDHDDSGLGSIFPMPGGLKENIQFVMGDKVCIDKAEGNSVFKRIETFAKTKKELLPDVFDVLNCKEGCNLGTACQNEFSMFEVNRAMDKNKKFAAEHRNKAYYDDLYAKYDNTFDISHFMRKYIPVDTNFPEITEKDIEKAFVLLNKTDKEKQNVDCGACGSDSCYNMARKISLGVNIPANCIVKSLEDSRREHDENLSARERLLTMERIREADDLMRTMMAANPNINILINSRLQVVDCNPAALNFFGFEEKEDFIAGFIDRMNEVMPPTQSDETPTVPLIERFMTVAMQENLHFENEVIMNGEIYNLDFTLKRIPYENSFAIVANILDITEIYKREKELKIAHEQNKLQLAKLNTVIHATRIGLWSMEVNLDNPMDEHNTFIWSDEFRNMFGFKNEEEFPNKRGSFTKQVHPEDLLIVNWEFENHLFDLKGNTPFDTEFRAYTKTGELRFFRACGETTRDAKGHPMQVSGALMDITESKNTLFETERLRQEAEAASKAKSSFLSTMSHEIRTPMNAILGVAEIQLQNELHDLKVRDAFEKIHSSGDMLLGIINDILDLSKIEAGKMELVPDQYEIASFISDTVQLNIMRIGSKPIGFELNIDENIPAYVFGDELRVKQVLNNLLSNAFKYTKKGTVTMDVSSEDSGKNDVYLIFSVSDTGQGMTQEQVDKLFDEYSRFNQKANRKTEGTGLGMAITRNLLTLMNGDISIKSEPGVGSTFTVRLLQGKVSDEILGKDLAESLKNFRTKSRSQMSRVQITRESMPYGSVLIVDDVEINIFVAQGLLSAYKLQIDTALSGFAAIEKIQKGNVYDIIFMDHMMPEMDGIETTKKIREMGYTQPIVALTANAVAGQAEIFLGNGFDDFISKPIDVRQMNIVLNKLIRDKQLPDVLEKARLEEEQKDALDIDPAFAEVFLRDAAKSIKVFDEIEEIIKNNGTCTHDELRKFTIHVHGMKSALANIGKMDLSAVALKLETSARDEDIETVSIETPEFLKLLKKLVKEMTPEKVNENVELTESDIQFLKEKLGEINASCENFDEAEAEKAISAIKEKTMPQNVTELLSAVSENLLHSDFDKAVEAVNEFMKQL